MSIGALDWLLQLHWLLDSHSHISISSPFSVFKPLHFSIGPTQSSDKLLDLLALQKATSASCNCACKHQDSSAAGCTTSLTAAACVRVGGAFAILLDCMSDRMHVQIRGAVAVPGHSQHRPMSPAALWIVKGATKPADLDLFSTFSCDCPISEGGCALCCKHCTVERSPRA